MPLRYIAALPIPALCPAPLMIFGARPHPNRFLTASSSSPPSQEIPKLQQQKQRLFHATGCLRDEEIDRATNHYEALKLPTNASPADIKRSFYTLSKTQHPDHNRSDPAASKRFMRISEAYTTLSSPEKRTRYDRDVLNLHHPHEAHPGRRGGSYSSTTTNPAGGRPASGLSKRRSFLPQRGLGRPQRETVRGARELYGGIWQQRYLVILAAARRRKRWNVGDWWRRFRPRSDRRGMGPGQDPFKGSQEDVPHFDREGHQRTGRRTEEARTTRRRMRMDGREVDTEAEQGAMGMFFVIGGIILTSFLVPLSIYHVFWGPRPKERKKKAKS
ncbi:hypothetical protein PG996_000533 [Apiospora saccharicola]|uniref:J domain-containing protein n=1 Tax=Apiospora saccharicola TaxID=335842 RepID=A0ABR1WE11_9PEZI